MNKTLILHLTNGASITLPDQTPQDFLNIQAWINCEDVSIFTVKFGDCDMHIINKHVVAVAESKVVKPKAQEDIE